MCASQGPSSPDSLALGLALARPCYPYGPCLQEPFSPLGTSGLSVSSTQLSLQSQLRTCFGEESSGFTWSLVACTINIAPCWWRSGCFPWSYFPLWCPRSQDLVSKDNWDEGCTLRVPLMKVMQERLPHHWWLVSFSYPFSLPLSIHPPSCYPGIWLEYFSQGLMH